MEHMAERLGSNFPPFVGDTRCFFLFCFVLFQFFFSSGLRRWTREREVTGTISGASGDPSSNGYQVEQRVMLCEWLQLQICAAFSPREMRPCKHEFQ